MFDIFLMEDVRNLMKKKSVVFMGDSNVRALYKDFLCLLRSSKFISDHILKTKMENSVFGDKLVYHGEKTNARCYREEREAIIESTYVSFYFLTKIYDKYVKEVLKKIMAKSKPDVIVVNSCLWDITRWGFDGVERYKENLKTLMKEFQKLFPDCLIIWVTAPPIACEVKGGFLVKELQFLKYSLRFHVVEANHYARKVVIAHGFDVLDTHYHLHMQIHRRCKDGIHWLPKAVRYLTNLLLRHISLSWDVALPHRYEPVSVDENLLALDDTANPAIEKGEGKENVEDAIEICYENLAASSKPGETAVKSASKQKKRIKNVSAPSHKVPRKEESICSHMTKNEKKARHKRIQKWKKQPLLQNHQANCSSTARRGSNFLSNSVSSHPYDNLNFSANPSQAYFSSYNNFCPPGFTSNFSSQFQNCNMPYVFPQVAPGQRLRPNFYFTNDEIPPNFRF